MRTWNRLALVLFAAACGSHSSAPVAPNPGAGQIAVPLTAATAQIAAPAISQQEVVPWSLTASDGSGLALVRVQAKSVVQGPLAYTELHLWFHNPEQRRREGTFQITLPEHAAVSRFAMESEGQWLEAEVVEKQLARRAYDDFLHKRQDPALLEKAPGNQFTAKVFPIAAGADKQIVISYSQELRDTPYTLPLRGLAKIGTIDVELATTGADGKPTTQALHEHAWQPDHDFVADSALPSVATGVMAGNLVAMRVPVQLATATATTAPKRITLLVDTSASRALGYASYVAEVHALIDKLAARYGANLELDVVAFDQDHESIYSGAASGWSAAHDTKLIERGAAGASDLGQALAALGSQAQRQVIVIGDGVITAGLEHAELAAAVKRTGAERLDVALAGGMRDADAAGAIVHAGLAHAGAVLDFDANVDDVAAAIAQPVGVDVPVSVAGATWQFPRTLPTARSGTTAIVYAKLAKSVKALDVSIGGRAQHVALAAATEPLVDRAIASAEIEELEAKVDTLPAAQRAPLQAKLAALSVEHRVVSNEASLLVLETADDYRRYGIEPKALADILVVGPNGVERVPRTALPAAIGQQVAADDRQDQATTPATKYKTHHHAADDAADDDAIDDVAGKEAKKSAPAGARVARAVRPEVSVTGVASSLRVAEKSADEGDADGDAAPDPKPAESPAPPPPPPAAEPASPAMHEHQDDGALAVFTNAPLEQRPAAPSRDAWPPNDAQPALTGQLADIEHAIAAHHVDAALTVARDWHAKDPGDVLALVGLGDALEANGSTTTAARIYGSIIDLFPGRADLRRFAGERMQRIAHGGALPDIVLDTYRRAVVDRPDHLTGHRLYAYALERSGKHADAFAAVLQALDQPYRNDSYAGGMRTLGDDAGLIGAAYAAAVPGKRGEIEHELHRRGLELATKPSTRFILYWETDANDVDFHIQDAHGNHAFFSQMHLASGGDLYADITTGYGPECFAINGVPSAGPYKLSLYYYSQGPMGYGMGLVEAETFDGKGHLAFDDRPYVIMNDRAYVDLGSF